MDGRRQIWRLVLVTDGVPIDCYSGTEAEEVSNIAGYVASIKAETPTYVIGIGEKLGVLPLVSKRRISDVRSLNGAWSMIAQNIAHEAILAGHSVLVVTAAQLLLDLAAQDSARALDRRLKHYAKESLLVIDEVGYLAFDNRNADLLFQVVSRRYERKSLVLTSGPWGALDHFFVTMNHLS